MIRTLDGKTPKIDPTAFISEFAYIIDHDVPMCMCLCFRTYDSMPSHASSQDAGIPVHL